ncbi:Methyl-CpG-binding domain protein 5 [Orobanche gracilis]
MSEPHIPDPVAHPEESAASPGELPADPLLGSDSFIDPERTETGVASPERQQNEQTSNAGCDVAIAAEPISILRPGGDLVETAPRSARRRNAEEMSTRPSWLPDDWKIDLRVRSSGATAGLIDRYFVEPSGQHRFRSKVEVLHFLETGSKKKKKSTSEANDARSASPVSQKKSSKKRKKSDSDAGVQPHQHVPNGGDADAP